MPVSEYFDPCLDHSNWVYRQLAEDHKRRYELVAAHLAAKPLPPGSLIVDAACGAGYGLTFLAHLGHRYLGFDKDHKLIMRARSESGMPHYFRVVNLEDCTSPFHNLNPDAIISLETAEHLDEPERFIFRCHEALPSGGLFFFSVPTSLTRDFVPSHKHDWDVDSWGSLLTECGFIIEESYNMPIVASFSDFTRTIPNHTIADKIQVGCFWLTHPHYLANRLKNWLWRGEFFWQSTLFICVKP